jgi:hypothetical protein
MDKLHDYLLVRNAPHGETHCRKQRNTSFRLAPDRASRRHAMAPLQRTLRSVSFRKKTTGTTLKQEGKDQANGHATFWILEKVYQDEKSSSDFTTAEATIIIYVIYHFILRNQVFIPAKQIMQ